jgi:hypothetical protein
MEALADELAGDNLARRLAPLGEPGQEQEEIVRVGRDKQHHTEREQRGHGHAGDRTRGCGLQVRPA